MQGDDLRDKLKKLAERAVRMSGSKITEEATKQALVQPFLTALGYDVFDPAEFVPEYNADVPGLKQGEKVDYAILIGGMPEMIIEAKALDVKLSWGHASQLFRYFTCTPVKIALLTNGLDYLFYTDFNELNKMDGEPFLHIRLNQLTDLDLAMLAMLGRDRFDAVKIRERAFQEKHADLFLDMLRRQFVRPDDRLVRLFMDLCNIQGDVARYRESMALAMRRVDFDAIFGQGAIPVENESPAEEKPAQVGKSVKKATEKPEKYVIITDGNAVEHAFNSWVDVTIAYCEAIMEKYGAVAFTEKVIRHEFRKGVGGQQPSKRIFFSMSEEDMRGFSFHKFDNGLCLLKNFSASSLAKIRDQLFAMFPDVACEVCGVGHTAYWQAFLEYAFRNQEFMNEFSARKVTGRHYLDFGVGSSKYHFAAIRLTGGNEMGCLFYIKDDDDLYRMLLGQKDAIESELGSKLDWRAPNGVKCRNIKMLKTVDFNDASKQQEQFDWLIGTMLRMKRVFMKYI